MTNATCSIEGCGKPKLARGWCSKHHSAWQRHGDPEWIRTRISDLPCSIDGCSRPRYAQLVCSMHRRRFRKTGSYDLATRITKTCSAVDCERPVYGRGYCQMHWKRWRKYGAEVAPERTLLRDGGCRVEGCGNKHRAGGFCGPHYDRLRRTGWATPRKRGEVVDGKRICAICKVDTPLEEMSRSALSYCRKCVNIAARNRPSNYVPKTLGLKRCEWCNELFPYNAKQRLHCSAACADKTVNRRNWKHLQARRARIKELFVESFSREEILERDNWICGICAEPINPDLKLPDMRSASIDHIIPVSKGGFHERANVQAAHLRCNVVKGARIA